MSDKPFWSRVKDARLFQVIIIYLAASWIVLQVVVTLRDALQLPPWIAPVSVILLVIGLVIIAATVWVQSHPLMPHREAANEVPQDWELDLGEIKESISEGRLPHLNWARVVLVGVFSFSILFGLAGLYVVVQDRGESFSPPEEIGGGAAPGIAVLPFTVQGEGLEMMREGMVSLLSAGLDGAGGLRTIAPGTVFARWREQDLGGATPELNTALDVALETGARYALVGSAVAVGADVRLLVDVYDVDTGARLGQARVEGSPEDVLPLVDRLAVEALRVILQKGEDELPEINLASLTTESPEALQAFLEGEVHFRKLELRTAERAFTRATEADSTFALAYYRLAEAQAWNEEANPALIGQYRQRAAQLAERLPTREALVIRGVHARSRHELEGIDLLRQAVQKHPEYADAWNELGELLLHLPGALASAEEIDDAFTRAVALDPRNARYVTHYAELAWWLYGDSTSVAQRFEEYIKVAPADGLGGRAGRLGLALGFGDSAAQSQAMADLAEETPAVAIQTGTLLFHPRYDWESVGRVLYEFEEFRNTIRRILFVTLTLWRGRLNEGLSYLEEPAGPAAQHGRATAVCVARASGLSLPEELTTSVLGSSAIDNLSGAHRVLCAGALAADRGRWADYDRAVAELERRAERAFVEADSVDALRSSGRAKALEGYGLWRRGQPTAALALLEASQARVDWVSRWWLGRLYYEVGRLGDSERVFQSASGYIIWSPLFIYPLAQLQLGKVYEDSNQYDKALESYEYFVHHWRDADAELQPMVEEARQAVIRLKGLQRE